jgi:hypothetical protein
LTVRGELREVTPEWLVRFYLKHGFRQSGIFEIRRRPASAGDASRLDVGSVEAAKTVGKEND